MFVEPLGELLRDNANTLGISLPRPSRTPTPIHSLGTQFADDTTLYSAFPEDLEAAQRLIEEEFCTASGAKLNTEKTKIYCTDTHTPHILSFIQKQALTGGDWVKSLGGVYGPQVDPLNRFNSVVEKMESRMKKLQQYHPSFVARTLYANSLLSSCVWYFVYFIPPSKKHKDRFNEIVQGMLWSRKPGS